MPPPISEENHFSVFLNQFQ